MQRCVSIDVCSSSNQRFCHISFPCFCSKTQSCKPASIGVVHVCSKSQEVFDTMELAFLRSFEELLILALAFFR